MSEDRMYTIWYAFCFALLGLIDQRRGSAEGTVQMVFANLTGVVIGLLLLPSLKRKKEFLQTRLFRVWSIVSVPILVIGCILGARLWYYPAQWDTAVLNGILVGYFICYLGWSWKKDGVTLKKFIEQKGRLNVSCFLVVMAMLLLMQLSVHEALWPIWFFFLFGCFYLIGIPKEQEGSFLWGMLIGIIVWFFVQQIIAFGFRPYDYLRYRGLYSGETQNGIFYMIAFCAFTGLWLLLKQRKAKLFPRILCFALSAGCVGFQLLTGGRASFVGIVAAAVLAYAGYDIIMCKSFKHWLLQGIMLGLCMIVLFPAVYGCVRYLPVILHHPIWFAGEYNADTSIHSYDPWNSERYISFEEALSGNIGRMLLMLGIQLEVTEDKVSLTTPLTLTAQAATEGEPGSSPENPFYFEETDFNNSISIRRTIYYYYLTHLNWEGHSKFNAGFYMEDGVYYGHAHNMFLQVAYDYGIVAGVIFLLWNVFCLLRLLWRRDMTGLISASFLAAILSYGCAEMAVTTGQITLVLLFILYSFGIFPVSGGSSANRQCHTDSRA